MKKTPELTGRIFYPGDPGWDHARHGFHENAPYDKNVPQVIVYAQETNDVVNAVKWARKNNVPIRARCGAHNYQAYSSLVKNGIIIDVSDMETMQLSSKRDTVVIGAGLDMLELSEKMAAVGVTFPLATGPSVGISGLTLGGGFGITSRSLGLTCDSLLELEMVNAEGEVLRANEKENSDLFWASRGGGGGNFGIVTEFTFKVHPISLVAAFNIQWPWSDFDKVVDAWQKWAYELDEQMTTLMTLTVEPRLQLVGQYNDPTQLGKVNQLLAPMLAIGTPIDVSVQIAPFEIVARMLFGVDPINPSWAVRQHGDQQIFKSTSAIAYEYMPMEAIQIIRKRLEEIPPLSAPPSQPSMIQLLGGGGAIAKVPPTATAVWHRLAKCVVQYDGYWTAPQDGPPTVKWVEETRNMLSKWAYNAYVNYSDADLVKPLEQYYAKNLKRLMEIKKKYDPKNVFNFPQSIPPA